MLKAWVFETRAISTAHALPLVGFFCDAHAPKKRRYFKGKGRGGCDKSGGWGLGLALARAWPTATRPTSAVATPPLHSARVGGKERGGT